MTLAAASTPGQEPLADWDLAARIAWLVASADRPQISRAEANALKDDINGTLRRADRLARLATGLGADLPPATVHVVGRRAWIRSNIASIADLTDPLADRLLSRAGAGRVATRKALGFQLGLVFGYLATRVLGQYEVFLPGGVEPGRLLLVGPNMLVAERTFLPEAGIAPADFRLGVTLHELAHRLQFEAVPWLRPHLRNLVDTYLSETQIDPDRVRQVLSRLGAALRDPSLLGDPQRLLEVFLTPAQVETIRRAQSLMSLLEGHGNVVMDWGAEAASNHNGMGASFDPAAVREALNRRRGRLFDQIARRAMGLSMKAEQYRVGERFIIAVAEQAGRDAFNRVWEDPAHIPTGDELSEPSAWIKRVQG